MCNLKSVFSAAASADRVPLALPQAPESALREAIVSRLEAIQSIIVEYDSEHSFFPRDALLDSPNIHIKTGTDKSNERFSYFRGSARWERTLTKETVEAQRLLGIPIVQTVMTHFASGTFEHGTARGAVENGFKSEFL